MCFLRICRRTPSREIYLGGCVHHHFHSRYYSSWKSSSWIRSRFVAKNLSPFLPEPSIIFFGTRGLQHKSLGSQKQLGTPENIAILGGGLTGLSSAFHLSRRFPHAIISLIEQKDRLGGWARSERVQLPGGDGSVVLEAGPRTLRPNAKSVLELIHLLNLQKDVITVSNSSSAAKSRYLYIPNSGADSSAMTGLQRLPSSITSLFMSPFCDLLLSAILREPFRKANRLKGANDESVDAFFSRRFGGPFARILGSALIHGIYAADARELSIRATFPSLWNAEERGRGSVIRGFLFSKGTSIRNSTDYELGDVMQTMRGVSIYSFKDGIQTLIKALANYLGVQSNVRILLETEVSSLRPMKGKKAFKLSLSSGESLTATHMVSALPLPALDSILNSESSMSLLPAIPHLLANPSSTVHVINLVFAVPPSDIHPSGFGYLIPRPKSGYPDPSDITSPRVLGVIFDSCSVSDQDAPSIDDYYNNGKFTKLTVMTGGPYASPLLPSNSYDSANSKDIPPFIQNILELLDIQLGNKLPNPVYWRVCRNEACIPTMLPGHVERVAEIKEILEGEDWEGRLEIIGAGVSGVSVGDCVEAGKNAGKNWDI